MLGTGYNFEIWNWKIKNKIASIFNEKVKPKWKKSKRRSEKHEYTDLDLKFAFYLYLNQFGLDLLLIKTIQPRTKKQRQMKFTWLDTTEYISNKRRNKFIIF